MFVLSKDPVAWVDIDWTSLAPGSAEEGSVTVERSIRMKVKLLPRSELLPMLGGEVSKKLDDLVAEVAQDWSNIVDEDRRPVPFSIEKLKLVMEHEPGFAAGFDLSYTKACLGQGKVREGNSAASPADGQAGEAAPNRR
jgi:hypothetical protein